MCQAWKKTEEYTQYTCEPWETLDTYSGLQMSAILMNTPKIKFPEIRFLRIALKSQHRLAGIVLQDRQDIDLLILEKTGTWAPPLEWLVLFMGKYLQSS